MNRRSFIWLAIFFLANAVGAEPALVKVSVTNKCGSDRMVLFSDFGSGLMDKQRQHKISHDKMVTLEFRPPPLSNEKFFKLEVVDMTYGRDPYESCQFFKIVPNQHIYVTLFLSQQGRVCSCRWDSTKPIDAN